MKKLNGHKDRKKRIPMAWGQPRSGDPGRGVVSKPANNMSRGEFSVNMRRGRVSIQWNESGLHKTYPIPRRMSELCDCAMRDCCVRVCVLMGAHAVLVVVCICCVWCVRTLLNRLA